ncbi:MAG: carbohydrate ABC transporter permease [Phycisphaerales bacterium]
MRFSVKKILIYIALILTGLFFVFPFYWVLSSSLKSRECMSMVPPAYYPSEVRTVDLKMQAGGRIYSQAGTLWLKICESKDLLTKSQINGGYYVKLNQNLPTSQVEWFSDMDIKIEQADFEILEFSKTACHRIKGIKKPLAVVGRLVRNSGSGFNEIIFTSDADVKVIENCKPMLNVAHKPIRDFTPRWVNYKETMEGPEATFGEKSTGFAIFMRNSLFISILAVVGQILSSSFVAYGFSRIDFKGREAWFILVLATMMLPMEVTLIPLFAIYKSLGWINTFLPLIVPHFTAGAFNVFLMRQYMLTLPKELDESAEIDGCGAIGRYFHIILPNSIPVIIVVAIFTFVYTWQDVMGPLIYLDNPAYRTVTLGLEYFRSPYIDNRHLLMTGAVLAMLPVAILFIFLQKYIMSGIATTGIKG